MGPWVVRDGVVTTPALDALVRWTAESRGEGPEAYPDIAATWARFLERFDPVLRERDDLRFDYALEDALAELARIAATPARG